MLTQLSNFFVHLYVPTLIQKHIFFPRKTNGTAGEFYVYRNFVSHETKQRFNDNKLFEFVFKKNGKQELF